MPSRLPLLALLMTMPGSARADERPAPADAPPPIVAPSPLVAPVPRPSLTLLAGKLNVTLTLELDASADKVAEPTSIAPDVAYGATNDLTIALVHSKFALTGFRAVAGGGVCVTGSDTGCPTLYNNVGGEAWYALARDQVAVAAVAGVHALDLDRSLLAVKIGGKARYTRGQLAINALPSILVAINKRADAMGTRLNKDILYVPLQLTYRAVRPLVLGLGSGIKGPISGFANAWQVPLGITAQYAIDAKLGVGVSWVFGQLFGGATNPPDPAPAVVGPDLRGIQLWATYTI